jgi:methylaspartate ammonia-lyase
MKIKDVIATSGLTGYYFDDLEAIRHGNAKMDGFFYMGKPVTPGHKQIRQKGESISIMLLLEDGQVAFGDGCSIQYSNVVGRDPVFIADKYIPAIKREVIPILKGKEITTFRQMAEEVDSLKPKGEKLHSGIRYGVTQALLDAVAKTRRVTMAEVISDEYGTTISDNLIPVLAQSGDDRYVGADKMILKSIPVIPQGLFNRIEKIGEDGEVLLEYVEWLRNRVLNFGEQDYCPMFHLDVYGTIGYIFENDVQKIANYFKELEILAKPFSVTVECPIDLSEKQALIFSMQELRDTLQQENISIRICADDWCNTLEDIQDFVDARAADMIQIKLPDLGGLNNAIAAGIYCKENGVKAFMGGTCNGTDKSSRVTVHVALAIQADQIYNKPGMAVDEGYMIVYNEMQRTLALLKTKGIIPSSKSLPDPNLGT